MEPVLMHMDVFNTIENMRKQQAEIMKDPRLSAEGRKQSAAQIDAQRQAYATKALQTFAGDWKELKRVYRDLRDDRAEIAEKAAKGWDFQRLNYERTTAIGRITAAKSPDEIAAGYESVKLSGDRHAMRAYVETAASLLGGKKQFSDPAATLALKQAMQAEAERITTPPEMEAQREAESKLSGQIADLYRKTQQAANEFYTGGAGGLFSPDGRNPFMQLLDSVQVRQTVNTQLETITEVNVNWD